MKGKRHVYRKHAAALLAICGLALLALPFTLVAIDNLIGATRPGDFVINGFGVLTLAVGQLLVLAGLLWAISKITIRLTR